MRGTREPIAAALSLFGIDEASAAQLGQDVTEELLRD
jgi:hypothetical protein